MTLFTTARILFLALIVATAGTGPATAADRDRFVDRILVVVGEDVITQRELVNRAELTEQQLRQRGLPVPGRDVLVRQVTERMVLERTQLQEARRVGISIDELTLNRTMEDIARQNDLNLFQLRDALEAEGIGFADFREQIRDELTITQLRRRQVDNRVRVSEQEIDDLIAAESGAIDRDVRYRLAHILVALPQGADTRTIAAAQQKAESLHARARAGEDFAALAVEHSDAPDALEGGDMGWRGAGNLPTLYARQAVLMRPGDISPVLRSPSGFHVLRLVDRDGGQQVTIRQTRARHVLIGVDPIQDAEEARQNAWALYRRIRDGAGFAELARAHSTDTGSAGLGGDLGWLSPGETVPEFEQAMDRLAIGVVSEPVLSQFGWHLIEVLERREVDASRELVRARAREILQSRKREEETELWLRRLRDEAFVEYRVDAVRP